MKKAMTAAMAVLLAGLTAGVCRPAFAQEKAAKGRTLKVKLRYTGSGTVDDSHRILAFLFDSPDFVKGEGVVPFALKDSATKEGDVTFTDVDRSVVYIATAYDPSGKYDGQSPPPSGSSLGMYSTKPGEPAEVKLEPGKTVAIELVFDDSSKMP